MFIKETKGFITYTIPEGFSLNWDEEKQQQLLQTSRFKECGEHDAERKGFIPFVDEEGNESIIKSFAGLQVINIGTSKKKVPAGAVKKRLENAIAERKELFEKHNPSEEYKISKEDKDELKANIIEEMLPQCFSEETSNFVIIDVQESLVYVFNTNKKGAENLTWYLRSRNETFPVGNIVDEDHEYAISSKLSNFVTSGLNTKLSLGNYVELDSTEGKVTWKKESLYFSEAKSLIEDDSKEVTKIGLDWDGVVSFTVDNKFTISGLKFDSSVIAEGGSFEADVLIALNEIRSFTKELFKELSISIKDPVE